MKNLIFSLFGAYEPVTVIEHVWNPLTEEYELFTRYADGLAGLDWTWIAGVGLFALTLYCVFKLVGGVIKSL